MYFAIIARRLMICMYSVLYQRRNNVTSYTITSNV